MQAQRLRNLTTGRLHTSISHVYEDLEWIIGEPGLMTHMIPRVMDAVRPWLRRAITDSRFWDGEYDVTHTGEVDLPEPSCEDRAEMFELFKAMTNPLAEKPAVVVAV